MTKYSHTCTFTPVGTAVTDSKLLPNRDFSSPTGEGKKKKKKEMQINTTSYPPECL